MTGTFQELIAATLAFVAGHFLLSSLPLRRPLIRQLGLRGFRALYSLLITAALIWMVYSYGSAPYLALWHAPETLKWLPLLVMPLASILAVAGISTAGVTAVGGEKLLEDDPGATARGIHSVTRHPFLWGSGLWALSHLPVRGDLSSLILFGAIAVLSFAGMAHIDRRRAAEMGAAWGPVALTTSILPFAAILSGRVKADWRGIGLWRPLGGLALFVFLIQAHPSIIGRNALPAF